MGSRLDRLLRERIFWLVGFPFSVIVAILFLAFRTEVYHQIANNSASIPEVVSLAIAACFYSLYGIFLFPPAVLVGAGYALDSDSTWYDLLLFLTNIAVYGGYLAFIIQLKILSSRTLYLCSTLILVLALLGIRGCVPMVPKSFG